MSTALNAVALLRRTSAAETAVADMTVHESDELHKQVTTQAKPDTFWGP